MNNITISSSIIGQTSVLNNTAITTTANNNYVATGASQLNNFNNGKLLDRSMSIKSSTHATTILDLPNELLSLIFANLDVTDLSKMSKVCKTFFLYSQYYLEPLHLARNIFLEFSTISQEKIKLIFNRDNYKEHLRSWMINFTNVKNIIKYLDTMQYSKMFQKILFFYITKIIHQSTSLKAISKFTVLHDDIAISIGCSNNNCLFIAYSLGLIKIYNLGRDQKFIINREINLQQSIDFAVFSPDSKTIVIKHIDFTMSIIYSTVTNNWEVDNEINLPMSYVCFSPNNQYMAVISDNIVHILLQSAVSNKWSNWFNISYSSFITKVSYSYNSKYCAIGRNDGFIAIEELSYYHDKSACNFSHNNNAITSMNFSINSKYLVASSAHSTTCIYKLNDKTSSMRYIRCNNNWQKVYTIQQNTYNLHANAIFSTDGNSLLVNHGRTIIISGNLSSIEAITTTICTLSNNLSKAIISDNSNYIIIYTFEDSIIKLYRKNNKQKWYNFTNIDTKIKVIEVQFSKNEHHFVVISSEKIIVYNLCSCKKIVNNINKNILNINSNNTILTNKNIQSFTITTSNYTRRFILFNHYFCQLLIAYNNIIKIFMPTNTHTWNNKLTLTTDLPIIETVRYTNNGTHILVNSKDDQQSNIKLLAIN